MNDKKFKYKIIEYLKDKCDNCKISNRTLGTYIRGLHICGPLNIWLAMLYISKPVSIFFIFILFCLLAAFYIFDGCILTILEKNLCGDTFTFIDPFLEYYDLDLNTKNRYDMSIKVALFYIVITLCIFIYRFYI